MFIRKLYLFFIIFLPLLGDAHALSPCCENTITITPKTSDHAWPEEPIPGEEHLRDFNPELLYLLDRQLNTFFFRGNLPENKEGFCYDDLVNTIKKYLSNYNVSISDNFKIMDLSFLDYFEESKKIEIEKEWFRQHSDKGCFWLNSLYGAWVNPVDLPERIRDFILCHHDIDGLKTLMSDLKKIIDSPCSLDFVIYIHCSAGKDRTGEASACYLMQNKNYSYKDAIALDKQIAKRDLSSLSMNGIRWYAFYLRDIEKKPWIGEIDGK
jgi:hypothetical protein